MDIRTDEQLANEVLNYRLNMNRVKYVHVLGQESSQNLVGPLFGSCIVTRLDTYPSHTVHQVVDCGLQIRKGLSQHYNYYTILYYTFPVIILTAHYSSEEINPCHTHFKFYAKYLSINTNSSI